MTMTLLVGVGTEIITEATSKAKLDDLNLNEFSILLVFSLTLLLLTDKLPAMVSGIITGASVGGMGVGSFGAGAAVGAAMATSAAATKLAGTAISTGLGAAGLVSALRSAMQASSAATGTTPGGERSDGGTGRSLSEAMGVKPSSAARILAKGAASMAADGVKSAVGKTWGGRLASKISGESNQ